MVVEGDRTLVEPGVGGGGGGLAGRHRVPAEVGGGQTELVEVAWEPERIDLRRSVEPEAVVPVGGCDDGPRRLVPRPGLAETVSRSLVEGRVDDTASPRTRG